MAFLIEHFGTTYGSNNVLKRYSREHCRSLSGLEVPDELLAPAQGKFPRIEEALKTRGVQIPNDWQVEHLLAATCVGTAALARKNDDQPSEVRMIADNKNVLLPDQGTDEPGGYMRMGFEVRYKDGNNFFGSVNMPDHTKDRSDMWGLPWFIARIGNITQDKAICFDTDLFDSEARRFTDAGNRLIDFVAKVITLTTAQTSPTPAKL